MHGEHTSLVQVGVKGKGLAWGRIYKAGFVWFLYRRGTCKLGPEVDSGGLEGKAVYTIKERKGGLDKAKGTTKICPSNY